MTGSSYIIGIDTGGTYTDAVVIDAGNHSLLASAKAITTKGDLSVGVIEAMDLAIGRVPHFQSSAVQMVSVSTTLATNAVVEGHGGAVGLLLAGFDERMLKRSGLEAAFPSMPILRMAGGHDLRLQRLTCLLQKRGFSPKRRMFRHLLWLPLSRCATRRMNRPLQI